MRKIMFQSLLVLIMVFLFVGCSKPEEKVSLNYPNEVTILVTGLVTQKLTQSDFNKMTVSIVEATLRKSDGSETLISVKGVLLKDVLSYLKVESDQIQVTVIAEDGYQKQYDSSIILDEKTILAFYSQDNVLDNEGPIWLVAGSHTGNFWIRNLTAIIIE